MTKLARTLATAGIAFAVPIALAVVLALRGDRPDNAVLTGRTDQGAPFVTELDHGHITWFDATLFADCLPTATWRWNWHADRGTQRFEWTGTRLAARHAGAWQGREYTIELEAGYAPATGLKGRMRYQMDGCDSGWFSFWAAAER